MFWYDYSHYYEVGELIILGFVIQMSLKNSLSI